MFSEATAAATTTSADSTITTKYFISIEFLLRIALLFSCIGAIADETDGPGNYDILEDVINLPVSKFPEPDCKYRVRFADQNGTELRRQVEIGEPVYHHWTCSYGQQRSTLYCILVNNCTVSNSRPNPSPVVPIIDEFGCSLFPSVLPHVEYNGDLEGGLQTNAFSLDVDEPAITFHCNIKLLLKLHGICRRPQCIPIEWYHRRQQSNPLFF